MTITEPSPTPAAPEEVARTEAPPVAPLTAPRHESWFNSGDHKRLGLSYVYASLLFLVLGGVLAMVLRTELAEPGVQIVGDNFGRLFNMHATVTTLLFLAPFWVGLATYVVPLQLGAGRLALPRLHATALWLYVLGGGLLVSSYIVGPPVGMGLTVPAPPLVTGHAHHATMLWIASLIVLALSTILASTSLLTTIVMLRTDGLTFLRLPAFSWATMATSAVLLLSTPVYVAGLMLLALDQRFGGPFFAAHGSQAVWQHSLWLFGRPEVFMLTLPGLGVACDVVSTHARRLLPRRELGLAALSAFAVLSLFAWAEGIRAASAVVLPTPTVLTALVAAPVGLLVLLWLGALGQGRPRPHPSLLFVAGFVLLLVTGAVNGVVAAAVKIGGGSAWTTGNLHTVAFGAPTLLVFAGLYHWAPKLWGKALSDKGGALTFLLLFAGLFTNGMASYALGYQGAHNHVKDLPDKFTGFSRAAAVGGALVILGVVVFLADVVYSVVMGHGGPVDDDPYGGLTLEWATTSPPPRHGFDTVPEVRSAAPLADVRAGTAGTNGSPA
jgi:cytochrome c oxidase subunit 1